MGFIKILAKTYGNYFFCDAKRQSPEEHEKR